jgi:16S rRNA processing protein RimM
VADPLICVGKIGAPYGVRGYVRVWSYTADSLHLFTYPTLYDEEGESFPFRLTYPRPLKAELFSAKPTGVETRDAAASLTHIQLFVFRCQLKETDADTFYHADLVGLKVMREDGSFWGEVRSVHNFGAGDVLDLLSADGVEVMLPFNQTAVPQVCLREGHLTVSDATLLAYDPSSLKDKT